MIRDVAIRYEEALLRWGDKPGGSLRILGGLEKRGRWRSQTKHVVGAKGKRAKIITSRDSK